MRKETNGTIDEIKKAAFFQISKYGYDKTTLKSIAETVGIKTPSIYSHFNSKEQLFNTIIKDMKTKERERLIKLTLSLQNKSIKESLNVLFYYYTDPNNSVFWQIILKQIMMNPRIDILQNMKKDFIEFEKEISIQLLDILLKGIDNDFIKNKNTKQMTSLFFTLVDGLLVEQNLYDSEKYEERREDIWDLYIQFLTSN